LDYNDVVRDFVERTKQNLKVIEDLRARGGEVHEVTQLINSMLGLLVFPREEYVDRIPRIGLPELRKDGWPAPKPVSSFPEATDLRELIRLLRNAIAHFNIRFIANDSREITGIRVWNKPARESLNNL
jgi:hypothetical protein